MGKVALGAALAIFAIGTGGGIAAGIAGAGIGGGMAGVAPEFIPFAGQVGGQTLLQGVALPPAAAAVGGGTMGLGAQLAIGGGALGLAGALVRKGIRDWQEEKRRQAEAAPVINIWIDGVEARGRVQANRAVRGAANVGTGRLPAR